MCGVEALNLNLLHAEKKVMLDPLFVPTVKLRIGHMPGLGFGQWTLWVFFLSSCFFSFFLFKVIHSSVNSSSVAVCYFFRFVATV
jgi:hypothetical protein